MKHKEEHVTRSLSTNHTAENIHEVRLTTWRRLAHACYMQICVCTPMLIYAHPLSCPGRVSSSYSYVSVVTLSLSHGGHLAWDH